MIISATSWAQHDHHGPGHKPLLDLMRTLGDDLNQLNNAMFKDDVKAASEAAGRIADHPQVTPEEMKKISKALGAEMAKFKQWDIKVHEAAAKASTAKNVEEIAKLQGEIVIGCVSCHAQFRARVRDIIKSK